MSKDKCQKAIVKRTNVHFVSFAKRITLFDKPITIRFTVKVEKLVKSQPIFKYNYC